VARFATKSLTLAVLCLLGGCVTPAAPTQTSMAWLKSLASHDDNSDVVQIDAALLERPIEDSFLSREVWGAADHMVVSVDRRDVLEANGFRVGQIVGMTPAKLQELLRSERWCLDPRRRMVQSGNTIPQALSKEMPECSYDVKIGKQVDSVQLQKVRFLFDITATLTPEGKSRLKFVPKVENGEAQLPFEANPDQSAWTLKVDRAARTYPDLGWELDLAPNSYVIIGADLEKPNSLAYRAFVQDVDGRQVQRVLILRTSRRVKDAEPNEPTLEDIARASSSPPLAAQAVRASRQ
jgi:hypothetical protein